MPDPVTIALVSASIISGGLQALAGSRKTESEKMLQEILSGNKAVAASRSSKHMKHMADTGKPRISIATNKRQMVERIFSSLERDRVGLQVSQEAADVKSGLKSAARNQERKARRA